MARSSAVRNSNGFRFRVSSICLATLFVVSSLVASDADRIDALLTRANALRSPQQRRADLAVPLLQQAVALAAASHDTTREAKALTALGAAKISTAHHQEGKVALQKARELARSIPDPVIEMDALATLALLHSELAEYEESEAAFNATLMLATQKGNTLARIRALNGLAATADRTGRSNDGIRYGRQALQELDDAIRRGVKFPAPPLFAVPYNLAKALSEQGDFAAAAPLFDRARNAAEQGGVIGGIWHVLHETAEIYRLQGDLGTASRYYERALTTARRMEARDSEGMTLRALGELEEARGDLPAALRRYGESLQIFEKAEFRSELPQTLTSLSRVQFLSGDRRAARESLDRAAHLLASFDHPLGVVLAKLESGRQRLAGGSLVAANDDYRTALDIARAGGLRSLTASALDGLGDVSRASGNLAEAVRFYASAADAIDAMRANIPSIEQRTAFVAATHHTYEQWLESVVALWRETGDQQYAERAFLVAERERSRNMIEALRSAHVTTSRAAALSETVSSLQIELAADHLSTARRKTLLQRLDDSEHALDAMESAGATTAAIPLNVEAIRRALSAHEAFVEYAPLGDHLIVFLVTRQSLAMFDRPARDFAPRVSFFTELLSGPDSERAIPAGRALSHELLADVLLHVPPNVDRLIVSAAGELSMLPFGALPDPRHPTQPIIAQHEVAYAPSLAALAELRQRHQTRARYDLLGMAPLAGGVLASALPVYRSARLGPLPSSGAEVKAIAEEVRGHVDALIGESASESALKRTPLGDYKVLHFATHALIDPRFPSRSAIVLARGAPSEDGWLQPREIYRLKMSAQMVVLSACETAAGEISTAEGIHSLARAFTYAGAKSVVATLWKVEDRSATRFVKEMYSAVASGQQVATALRTAQLRVAGEYPYRNAREWAGWLMAGDPAARPEISKPVVPKNALAFAGMAFMTIVVAAAGFWIRLH